MDNISGVYECHDGKTGKPVPLTAGRLIELLQKVGPNTKVRVSSDEEGNEILPLAFVEMEPTVVCLFPARFPEGGAQ